MYFPQQLHNDRDELFLEIFDNLTCKYFAYSLTVRNRGLNFLFCSYLALRSYKVAKLKPSSCLTDILNVRSNGLIFKDVEF